MTPWMYLLLASCFEISFAISLKMYSLTSKWIYVVSIIFCTLFGFKLMSMAMKVIPVSVAYTAWTGIATVGVTVFGMLFLKESMEFKKLILISIIILCILGLRLIKE